MFALVPTILVDAGEKPEQVTAKSIGRRLEWDLRNWEKQLNSIWAAKNGSGVAMVEVGVFKVKLSWQIQSSSS